MTFHQNATILTRRSAIRTRAVTTTSALWMFHRATRAAATAAAPAESSRAVHWARTDTPNALPATIAAQLAPTIETETAARASLAIWWIHRRRLVSVSVQVLPAQAHGHRRRHIRASAWTRPKSGHRSPLKKASLELGAVWTTTATTDSPATIESRPFQLRSTSTQAHCAQLNSAAVTPASSPVPDVSLPIATMPNASKFAMNILSLKKYF